MGRKEREKERKEKKKANSKGRARGGVVVGCGRERKVQQKGEVPVGLVLVFLCVVQKLVENPPQIRLTWKSAIGGIQPPQRSKSWWK